MTNTTEPAALAVSTADIMQTLADIAEGAGVVLRAVSRLSAAVSAGNSIEARQAFGGAVGTVWNLEADIQAVSAALSKLERDHGSAWYDN